MLERFFYIELEEYLIGSVLFFFYIYRNQENDGLTLLSRRGDTTS